MSRKILEVPMELKELESDGMFSGYASVFNNVDLGMDVVMPGAFRSKDMMLTKDKKIRVLWQHDMHQPIGKATVAEDEKGLAFEGQLIMASPRAQEAHALMKEGILDGMSIGYDTIDSDLTEGGVRQLKRVKLWEISVVTFGMNPKARINDVKTVDDFRTIRDLENHLRDSCGLSKSAATKIATGGWPLLNDRRDADEGSVGELFDFLKTIRKEHSK
jgi:HK97 family phage prohead protease